MPSTNESTACNRAGLHLEGEGRRDGATVRDTGARREDGKYGHDTVDL